MALFAAWVVVAKIALRLPLQLWAFGGTSSRRSRPRPRGVPRRGVISLVGADLEDHGSLCGVGRFRRAGHFAPSTMVGVGTDLALLLLGKPENLVVAGMAGVLGHFLQFLVNWGKGVITGASPGFWRGLAKAMIGYIIFGPRAVYSAG